MYSKNSFKGLENKNDTEPIIDKGPSITRDRTKAIKLFFVKVDVNNPTLMQAIPNNNKPTLPIII